jgi:hypothetical protein
LEVEGGCAQDVAEEVGDIRLALELGQVSSVRWVDISV